MDAQGILCRFIHNRIFRLKSKDVIWSWRGLCFTAAMNVRQHNCGRGERLDPVTWGMTGADFFSVNGWLDAVRPAASQKTESICASPTRY
jgi:hypothetical protein